MARTISTSEAKAKLSAVINWAVENKDEVIVESRGNPRAVIIPFDDYEQYKEAKEQVRRRMLLTQLEKLANKIQSRNQDLTAGEADQLADRFTREVIEEMTDEGKITFQQG